MLEESPPRAERSRTAAKYALRRFGTRGVRHEPAYIRLLSRFRGVERRLQQLPAGGRIAEVATGTVQAWLIQPTREWLEKGDWSTASESVHELTRTDIEQNGFAVGVVADELTSILYGMRVLSDNPAYDGRWLRVLYTAAGAINPPFVLHDFQQYARHVAATRGHGQDNTYRNAEAAAQSQFPTLHRAGPDARRNAAILRRLHDAPSVSRSVG